MVTVLYSRLAADLLTYFRRFEAAYGARFTPGREAAEMWCGLLERGSWTSGELARLDEAMRQVGVETGQAAYELRLHYSGWRRGVGRGGPAGRAATGA